MYPALALKRCQNPEKLRAAALIFPHRPAYWLFCSRPIPSVRLFGTSSSFKPAIVMLPTGSLTDAPFIIRGPSPHQYLQSQSHPSILCSASSISAFRVFNPHLKTSSPHWWWRPLLTPVVNEWVSRFRSSLDAKNASYTCPKADGPIYSPRTNRIFSFRSTSARSWPSLLRPSLYRVEFCVPLALPTT